MKKLLFLFISIFTLSACTIEQPNTIIHYEYGNLEDAIVNTVEVVEKSTFCVQVYTVDELAGFGSGVIYKKEGNKYYLVTNEHVIDSGTKFIITNRVKEYEASLIGFSKEHDIAVLTFETTDQYEPVKIDINCSLKKGQHIIAIGTPVDIEYFNTVTVGVISNITASRIQHDAAINPGNSGGPLFDLTGTLIGLNTEKRVWASNDIPTEGIGFAINFKSVYDLIEKLDDNKEPIKRPVLGITITTLENYLLGEEDKSFIPADLKTGLVVMDAVNTGSAYGFIQKNDILISFNDSELKEITDLRNELYKHVQGDKATFKLYRNKELITVTFTL